MGRCLGVLNKGKLLVFDNEIMESEFYQQIGDAHYGQKIKEAFYNFDKSLEINEKIQFSLIISAITLRYKI